MIFVKKIAMLKSVIGIMRFASVLQGAHQNCGKMMSVMRTVIMKIVTGIIETVYVAKIACRIYCKMDNVTKSVIISSVLTTIWIVNRTPLTLMISVT